MSANPLPKVSLILPIYNKERFFDRCMDSIFAQTYNNLEIILVNDGSTDRSDEFCKKYANTDNRVVYVSHENRGVSAARNTGLDHATGDYILFIDADDYVENNLVEDIVKIFRESVKELDMVTFGTSRVDINRKISSITWDSALRLNRS